MGSRNGETGENAGAPPCPTKAGLGGRASVSTTTTLVPSSRMGLEHRPCDLEPVPSCEDCPERTRVCFIQSDDGLRGCSCRQGRWVCEPAGCDGWGPECMNAVNEGICEAGLGCGACCAFDGGAPVATWWDCTVQVRPFCYTDVVCSGP